jgi:hypothetical protein
LAGCWPGTSCRSTDGDEEVIRSLLI